MEIGEFLVGVYTEIKEPFYSTRMNFFCCYTDLFALKVWSILFDPFDEHKNVALSTVIEDQSLVPVCSALKLDDGSVAILRR